MSKTASQLVINSLNTSLSKDITSFGVLRALTNSFLLGSAGLKSGD